MTNERKRRAKAPYFHKREEKAVVDYINTNSADERHRIYNEILQKPFNTMVETILRRYPIHIGNYDIHEVEANALSHLIEHMVKFNSEKITKSGKKAKAFSYCQTIVRNYYKDHSKKTYNEKKTILSFDDYSKEVMGKSDYTYELDENNKSDLEALIDLVVDKIKIRINEDSQLKKNEIIVGEAIIDVLTNWHILFMEETPIGKIQKKVTNKYQKNKILHLLKEKTRLNTKEIRLSMKPYKEIYFLTKNEFYNEE